MANFISRPQGGRISCTSVDVPLWGQIQIGLWGFQEGSGGPALEVQASYEVTVKKLKDEGPVRVYQLYGAVQGSGRVEAVTAAGAVWDWIGVVVSPAKKAAASYGYFPNDVISAAVGSNLKWGVPASVTLAQWSVESNYGRAMPANSNNPFGMKGKGVLTSTDEVVAGKRITIKAQFRKFASMDEAFDEHGRLLATDYHYKHAMTLRDNPDAFADALTGVYATAPNYGAALKSRMTMFNLYQYDVK